MVLIIQQLKNYSGGVGSSGGGGGNGCCGGDRGGDGSGGLRWCQNCFIRECAKMSVCRSTVRRYVASVGRVWGQRRHKRRQERLRACLAGPCSCTEVHVFRENV